jgi:hypothetical protein
MDTDVLGLARRNIRATDTNSLLRLYDQAKEIFKRSTSQDERKRADKAVQHLAQELRKRNVRP